MLTRKADIGGSRIQVFEINQAILDALGALGASGCMTGLMTDRTKVDPLKWGSIFLAGAWDD